MNIGYSVENSPNARQAMNRPFGIHPAMNQMPNLIEICGIVAIPNDNC
jgi:hypothetical protein